MSQMISGQNDDLHGLGVGMSEPVSTGYIAVTAGGITVLGIITGLHPALMLAGAAGGWWAMSYHQQPMTLWGRLNSVLLSAVVAAWGAPVAAAAGASVLPASMTLPHSAVELVVALTLGLSTIEVLGRGILTIMRGLLSFVRGKTEKGQ